MSTTRLAAQEAGAVVAEHRLLGVEVLQVGQRLACGQRQAGVVVEGKGEPRVFRLLLRVVHVRLRRREWNQRQGCRRLSEAEVTERQGGRRVFRILHIVHVRLRRKKATRQRS